MTKIQTLIMVNICFPILLHEIGGSVLRLNDGSLLNLFKMVGVWLSMYVGEWVHRDNV